MQLCQGVQIMTIEPKTVFKFVDQKALQYIKYTFEARSAQYISVM